jgi:hypothetical protein
VVAVVLTAFVRMSVVIVVGAAIVKLVAVLVVLVVWLLCWLW